jgi:hypothetical protein
MKNKRHKPEEIVKKLREAAKELAGGVKVEEVCKGFGGGSPRPSTAGKWKGCAVRGMILSLY